MPNLLAAPRFWKNKAILVKIDAAYGTDPVPTGANNWFEARNVSLTPLEADKAERNIELPYMGNAGSILVSSWTKLAFDVALASSGAAGTAPKWAPALLACGCAETIVAATSAAYNLVSTAFMSATAYINIDGTLHKLVSCRGEVKGKLGAKGIPLLSFELTSGYLAPTAVALPAVTRTGWEIEEAVNSVNTGELTLNAVDLAFSSLEWSFGNQIARIDLPGPQREVAISNRKPTATATVLAPALGVFDPFALAQSAATVDLTNTHGSAAGKKVQTDMKVRVVDVGYDRIDEMLAYKLTLEPLPVDGNDEITITCL